MKAQINTLKLVHVPLSNQEAEHIKDDTDFQKDLKESNLYMIGQRAEAKFIFDVQSLNNQFRQNWKMTFDFTVLNNSSRVTLDIKTIINSKGIDLHSEEFCLEAGEKGIRIWTGDNITKQKKELVEWFTTEKLLHDKWSGMPGIIGLNDYRKFTQYKLLYVGISKKDDSLTRLVKKPHDTRLRILTNEKRIDNNSRLSDEIIFFFFKVTPLRIGSYGVDDEIDMDEISGNFTFDRTAIIADAEKAFVKILNSQYNKEKYANYPKGKDGLYDKKLTRYGYIIGEDITFTTDSDSINGAYTPHYIPFGGNADMIFIRGDNVSIEKDSHLDNKKLDFI